MNWTVLTIISTGLSTVSFAVAALALRYRAMPFRRLDDLELHTDDLETRYAQLYTAQRRMQARLAARVRRETEPDPDDATPEVEPSGWEQHKNETREQWKARMRKEIHAGRLKPHGR